MNHSPAQPVVGLLSPLVPGEWLAAHGAALRCLPAAASPALVAGRCAQAVGQAVAAAAAQVDLAVMVTTCDQQRRAAEEAGERLFLFNLPRTWRSPAAFALYRAELDRLAWAIMAQGGQAPQPDGLAQTMRHFEACRQQALAHDQAGHGAALGALMAAREGRLPPPPQPVQGLARAGVLLLADCLGEGDRWLPELIEEVGARIAVDASGWGRRTLPRRYDRRRLSDPATAVDELVDAWFADLPEIGRRPNDALFRRLPGWIGPEVAVVVVALQPWCDTWRAELPRLAAACPRPLVAIELGDAQARAAARTRLEAVLERCHD